MQWHKMQEGSNILRERDRDKQENKGRTIDQNTYLLNSIMTSRMGSGSFSDECLVMFRKAAGHTDPESRWIFRQLLRLNVMSSISVG